MSHIWTEQFLFFQFADAAAYVAFIAQLRDQFPKRFAELHARARAVRTLRYSQIGPKQ